MIIVDSGADANGTLAWSTKNRAKQSLFVPRRIGKRNARRNIFIIPTPVGLASIGFAAKDHREVCVVNNSVHHILHALVEKVMETGVRRNLISVYLIRRLQKRVADTVSKG